MNTYDANEARSNRADFLWKNLSKEMRKRWSDLWLKIQAHSMEGLSEIRIHEDVVPAPISDLLEAKGFEVKYAEIDVQDMGGVFILRPREREILRIIW